MRALTIITATALLLTAHAGAQSLVFPSGMANAEGDAAVDSFQGGVPWWSVPDSGPGSQYFHMQLISDLPASMRQPLTKMSFRRDGAVLPGLTLQQFVVEIEVKLSTSPNTAANASDTFANNVGNDVTTVVARKRVVFGADQFQGTFPEPFFYHLLFDQGTPFNYDGSKGSLCVDVLHYSNDLMHPLRLTPLTVAVDGVADPSQGPSLPFGGRCATSNPWNPPIELRTSWFVDGNGGNPLLRMTAKRQYGMHHSRGYLMLSTNMLGTGLRPPQIPGTPEPCGQIWIDPAQMFLLSISDSDDYGRISWPKTGNYVLDVPWNPYFGGFDIYAQELSYDIHSRGFLTSNVVLDQIPVYPGYGSSYGVRTLYASGPSSLSAVQGTLGDPGQAAVVEYQ